MQVFGVARGARLGVSQAPDGQRVGAEKLRRLPPAFARLQFGEEARHAARVDPGGGHQPDGGAVGLVFQAARITQLLFDGQRGADMDGELRQFRVVTGRHQAGDQQQRAEPTGGAHLGAQPRDVAPRDMRDLVRDNAGQFALVAGEQHQALVDDDNAARRREGVDGAVGDRQEMKVNPVVGVLRQQPRSQRLQVILHFNVAGDRQTGAQLGEDGAAQFFLVGEAQGGVGGVADFRHFMVVGVGGHQAGGGRRQHRRQRQRRRQRLCSPRSPCGLCSRGAAPAAAAWRRVIYSDGHQTIITDCAACASCTACQFRRH